MLSEDEEENIDKNHANNETPTNFQHKTDSNSLQKTSQKNIHKLSFQSAQNKIKISNFPRKSLNTSNITKEEPQQYKNERRKSWVINYKKSKVKHELLSIPNLIKNIQSGQGQTNNKDCIQANRKLFLEEENLVQELKKRTKMSSFRCEKRDLILEKQTERFQQENISEVKVTEEKESIYNLNQETHQQYNRSKTLLPEKQKSTNRIFYSGQKKQYIFSNKKFSHKKSFDSDKFHQKIQFYCQLFQKEGTSTKPSKSKFKSFRLDSQRKQHTQISTKNFSHEKDNKAHSKDSLIQQRQLQKIKGKNQKKTKNSFILIKNQEPFCIQGSQKKLKIIIKSNSNNQGFIRSKYVNMPILKQSKYIEQQRKNTQQNAQKQVEIIDFTSYQTKKGGRYHSNSEMNAQRLHDCEAAQQKSLRMPSNKRTKQNNKFTHNYRGMKISNNIDIVVKDNNKTKINIFHNSLLLRENPQKIEQLNSILRDTSSKQKVNTSLKQKVNTSSKQKVNKIKVPFQLGINKLKIQQKNNFDSERICQNNFNRQIEQIVKKVKKKRKQKIHKIRTERKNELIVENVQPWSIYEQKQSNQMHNQQFYV